MDAPHKISRRVKLLLAGSLALNLLFIGLIAGAAFRHGGGHGPGGVRINGYAAPYMQALPRAQRRALHKALRVQGAIPDKTARRALYQNVLEGLRAEPFDMAALGATITKQGQAVQDVQGAAQAAWLKLVAEMAPAERLSYADALEQRLKHGPRRGRHKDRK